jgi:lysophospholipase L1-like esterase
MNTIPNAVSVLCYGDSNTYGQRPDGTRSRHAANVRWTGQLQALLGDGYYIIEEGLSSRTTNLDYPKKPGRNGKTYLAPCLQSHNPIDIVILMLGTNDLKIEFNRSAEDIANAIGVLLDDIQEYAQNKQGGAPRIILVSPILVDIGRPGESSTENYNRESAEKSQQVAKALEPIAKVHGCLFADASSVSKAGEDGIHFSEESHGRLAELLAECIVRVEAP